MSGQRQTVFSIQARLEGLEHVVAGFGRMTDAAGRTGHRIESSAQRARKEWDKMNTTFSRVYQGLERLSSARVEIGAIWRKGASDLRVYTDETRKLLREQEKLKTLGLGQKDNERAFKAVRDTVGQIKGLRLDKTTADLTDLKVAFGSLDMAIEALPMFSKFRFGLESIFGEDVSKDRMDQMVKAGGKFLEILGKIKATGPVDPNTGLATYLERDRKEMEKYFAVLVKGSASTGGEVTMVDMLTMARTGKSSVQALSPEGIATLMTLMPEMGAPQTGVAMMSLMQNLKGGRMSIHGMNRLAQLGLVNMDRVQLNKAKNKIIKLLPGAIKGSDKLLEDPLLFADEFAKVLATRGGEKGKGIDTSNLKDVMGEVSAITRDRTAQALLVALITRRDSILRQRGELFKAEGPKELYTHGLDTVEGKFKRWENALANFQAGVGGPLVDTLAAAAEGAMPFLRFLGEHPTATLMAIAIGKIGSAAVQTAAALRLSGVFGLFSRGAVPAAGGAADPRKQWDALFTPQTTTSNAGKYRAVGTRIGSLIGTGLGVGLALWGLESIISSISKRSEVEAAARDAGAEVASIMRGGFEGDISQMPEAVRQQFFKQKAMTEAGRMGELKVRKLSLQEGPAASGESQIAMALLAAINPQQYAPFAPSALNEMAQRRGAWSFAGMGEESQKKYATEFVDNLLKELQIKSDLELATFLQKGREALEKGGAGEAIPFFEERLKALYPELFRSYEDQITQQRKLMEQYGYTGDKVRLMGEQAEKVAEQLGKVKTTEKDEKGQPLEKRARGGIVMRPTALIAGEKGPEWIHPYHETIDALRGGGGNNVTLNAPVTIHVNGAVDASQVQEIRRQARAGVKAGAEEALALLERRQRYNEQLR